MDEAPRRMFSEKREKEFSEEEINITVGVLRSFAAETIRGKPKALPLELRQAVQALVVEPAVEIIITDEQGRYALVPRPPDDSEANKKWYGEQKLHIAGGFLRPNREGAESVGPIGTGIRMAKEDTGLDVVPVSGPIAMYQWTRTKEHPTGWPLSLAFVFKVVGGTPKENIRWFDADSLPTEEELITGNSGRIHRGLIEAYQAWRKDPHTFIDLNEKLAEKDGSRDSE